MENPQAAKWRVLVGLGGCSRKFASPIVTQRHKSSIKCSSQSSFSFPNQNKISHNNNKPPCKPLVPLALQDGHALQQSEDDNKPAAAPSFLEVVKRKLNAISHVTRYYAQINIIVSVTSVCFLPVQSLSQVTPAFLLGVLKAVVAQIFMNISLCSLNQICDVEIDKINKPYLPLASGELSMGTGIAICAGSALLSLALAFLSGSPAVLCAVIAWGLTGAAYSVPLPFLRWKSHTFMAPFTLVILMGLILQIPYFIHSQTYLLGKPFEVTGPFVFATAIMSIYAFVNGLLKVLPLCVNMMLLGFGGAVVAGATSTLMISKLVTIIGHIILALMMWLRSRKVDLDNFDSQFGFYMFLWQASDY
ncbi:putative homogentisate phytyltransferase 1 [Citrus sinensis]|nr:putative homogentisate phytyltransferase 1 [Citrus sinensis]